MGNWIPNCTTGTGTRWRDRKQNRAGRRGRKLPPFFFLRGTNGELLANFATPFLPFIYRTIREEEREYLANRAALVSVRCQFTAKRRDAGAERGEIP